MQLYFGISVMCFQLVQTADMFLTTVAEQEFFSRGSPPLGSVGIILWPVGFRIGAAVYVYCLQLHFEWILYF